MLPVLVVTTVVPLVLVLALLKQTLQLVQPLQSINTAEFYIEILVRKQIFIPWRNPLYFMWQLAVFLSLSNESYWI